MQHFFLFKIFCSLSETYCIYCSQSKTLYHQSESRAQALSSWIKCRIETRAHTEFKAKKTEWFQVPCTASTVNDWNPGPVNKVHGSKNLLVSKSRALSEFTAQKTKRIQGPCSAFMSQNTKKIQAPHSSWLKNTK